MAEAVSDVSVAAQMVAGVQRSPSPFPLTTSHSASSSDTPPAKKKKRMFHRYLHNLFSQTFHRE